jgi:nucleoside phosphorylase/CheY-like chemotaxis protein
MAKASKGSCEQGEKLRIIVLEDSNEKFERVAQVLREEGLRDEDVARAKNVAAARASMSKEQFTLLVLDVQVPMRDGEREDNEGGIYLLKEILFDDVCLRPSYVVGLTGVPEVYGKQSALFQRQGWALLEYSASSTAWSQSLRDILRHIRTAAPETAPIETADVVLLTALADPEFTALRRVFPELSGPHPIDARTLSWRGDVQFNGKSLKVVSGYSWQMGLTATAILAERFVARFQPKILAMSGICAGRRGKVGLGDVVVGTQSWEWQGGKIADSDGEAELLHAPEPCRAAADLLLSTRNLIAKPGWRTQLDEKYMQTSQADWNVHLGPMLSGLSVVANGDVMTSIARQHRNVLGLEMEAYAIYAAATFAASDCKALVVKGVCDFGDAGKEDSVQKIAAHRSAMVLRAILEEHVASFG